MAVEMDEEICAEMRRHPYILWRRKTHVFRKVIRRLLREFDGLRKFQQVNFQPRWNVFSENQGLLQRDGYVFVENFLNATDYEVLINNWPKKRYFTPIMPYEDHKTSDKGLYC